MSYTISASVDQDVHAWITQEVNRSQTKNLSKVVNFFLREAMERRKKENPQMLECPKHPGSSYSSRLSECPLCAEARTKAEIEARDSFMIFERKRLSEDLEAKQKVLDNLVTTLNNLDPETSEAGRGDKLNKEIDDISAEVREIKTKLSELV